MNSHDQALVIGIQRYRDGTDRWLPDLQGPDNDAAAVAEWLKKPDGGGLPEKNVRVVRSADMPDPFPNQGSVGPAQQAVRKELLKISQLPTTAFEDQWAGRRFYLYVSGHGLAKQLDEPALVTADAWKHKPRNILVTTWIRWLHKAAQFQEFVLWVDSCATRAPTVRLYPCTLPERVGQNLDEVKRFIAFAAPLGKRAVENQMPDGKWHGVFTYALLEGLNGSTQGAVTTNSLRDFLTENMKSYMRTEQLVKTTADEPAFGTTDPMTFTSPAQTPTFAVTLRFGPACVGKRATVVTNASNPPVAETVLKTVDWNLSLEAGNYAAFVPDMDLVQPFAVTGGGSRALITVS
jgi:hypothetical protein